ncbi:DUF3558 family protein [Actinoplanes friuliensis]|uniref:DUF3558 domain-containing protein n=1 Tax=Actinoplanes friuliensis DSM 7358 TaxID=1246995 RepID=U5W7D7_9ACTN|nr:DUF3558 family protein [Actinoplanes friuliensis]AGZ45039.1 hypothetical protein AFR_33905 [Actinoplanes friuliensis DSM 7358]
MNRRPLAALVAVAASLVVLSGCGALSDAAGSAAAPAPTPTSSPASDSGLGDSVKDSGDIPDPCTLLSKSEVKDLTGREISQIDEDGVKDGDSTRYCQWQQPSGQLAVFLSRTTEADFQTSIAEAEPVDGVGENAFALGGHLFVLYGTVSIDVYNRGDSDEENLAKAKKIAKVLIPKI